jgi:hypothetical protein
MLTTYKQRESKMKSSTHALELTTDGESENRRHANHRDSSLGKAGSFALRKERSGFEMETD